MSELIYGRRAVLESLRAARRLFYRLWLEESAAHGAAGPVAEIRSQAEAVSMPIRILRGGLFDKLSSQQINHQGVALEVGGYPYVELDDILDATGRTEPAPDGFAPLILLLDHVQDPQNLGSLFRTADAMAVDGVLIPERRAAGISPAVVNASAGAVEHLLVAQVTNLNQAIDELKERNYWIAGLEDDADAQEPNDRMLNGALAVVVGNEGAGLSRLTREKCDFTVRLPMYGRVESLNASVAGSILLYLVRQAHRRSA
jgi:23S rRNA (guanosine2251-2'-O)-methyltransferase